MSNWERRLAQALVAILISLAILYAVDSALFRFRISRGTAYGVVQVNQFLATPLKGNKMEYDLTGTVPQTCSRSLFPQKGNSACWWLRRHQSQWQ